MSEKFFEPQDVWAVFYEPRIAALEADNARLRALLKEVETVYYYDESTGCPFCSPGYKNITKHHSECPAFTPEGEVR